jgi:hypothetical protein
VLRNCQPIQLSKSLPSEPVGGAPILSGQIKKPGVERRANPSAQLDGVAQCSTF